MKITPIFDSLTHPTIDGNWILPRYLNSAKIGTLKRRMREFGVKWAFSVGMKGIGGYSEKEYINIIRKHSEGRLFPIAFYDYSETSGKNVSRALKKIKKAGYFGIKLHPRISNFQIDRRLAEVIKVASDNYLIVLLCTYPYGGNKANKITPVSIMEMLSETDGSKVTLMHGGAVRLLEYMEITRAFDNVLLDLSLTICKYDGSSLDMDIAYIFEQFDRRICIGSDHPEHSLEKLRGRFEYFSKKLSQEKKENIGYRNIIKFNDLKM